MHCWEHGHAEMKLTCEKETQHTSEEQTTKGLSLGDCRNHASRQGLFCWGWLETGVVIGVRSRARMRSSLGYAWLGAGDQTGRSFWASRSSRLTWAWLLFGPLCSRLYA